MRRLADILAARAEPAMRAEMERLRGLVQQRIGKPVERRGGRTIRSTWGEPPRRDKGDLQASAAARVAAAVDSVLGSVSVSRPYARPLNNDLNRPIFGHLLRAERSNIKAALRAALTKRK